jgi:hypothetical protein
MLTSSVYPRHITVVTVVLIACFYVIAQWGGRSIELVSEEGRKSVWLNAETQATLTDAGAVTRNASLGDAKLWPFRFLKRGLHFSKLLGRSGDASDAVCELMVLGHPLCDRFLTDPAENPVHHEEGAMMECIEEYGGIAAWNRMLQPQCTKSTFWKNLVRATTSRRRPATTLTRNVSFVSLMDPIMRLHVGPASVPYVPVKERTYSIPQPPLECRPPEPDMMAWRQRMEKTSADAGAAAARLADAFRQSFVLADVDATTGTITTSPPGPLVVHPIGFGFPSAMLVRKPYRVKMFDWFPVTPGYYHPDNSLEDFNSFPARQRYAAHAQDEYMMSLMQRLSYFSWTHSRGGPDCMRHYEILAAGGVPYFPDISLFPRWVLSHLPKELLKRVHHLPGVQHIGSLEDLLSPSDLQVYNQTTSPKWVKAAWQQQYVMLMDRLERYYHNRGSSTGSSPPQAAKNAVVVVPEQRLALLLSRCVAVLERRSPTEAMLDLFWGAGNLTRDRALLTQILSTEITGDGCASAMHTSRDVIKVPPSWEGTSTEWALWMIAMVLEEFYDEGHAPIRSTSSRDVPTVFSPIKTKFFFRIREVPTFNFVRSGSIDWTSFSPPDYHQLANDLHEFSRKHLSTASVAASFLRVLGKEEARRIVFFGAVSVDYMTFSLWHGLSDLGINITAVPIQKHGRVSSFVPSSELVRDVEQTEGHHRIWGGLEYAAWRRRKRLDSMYGKNFLVGKRIPHHPMITQKAACELIANVSRERDKVDVIVLGFGTRTLPFGAYPCARELRELNRQQQQQHTDQRAKRANKQGVHGDVAVAYVDGSDVLNVQTAASFFEEGITVFAREPACW